LEKAGKRNWTGRACEQPVHPFMPVVVSVVISVVIYYNLSMGYSPVYTITPQVLRNIAGISASREIIEHSRIIPAWEIKLAKDARLHNTHASTSIEGNRLTLDQVSGLAENKDVAAPIKDKQEVLNYLKAIDSIPRYAAKKDINIRLLQSIHRTLTRNVLNNPRDCGVFRDRQVFVGKRVLKGTVITDVVEYMPPKAEDVPGLVSEFLYWLNSAAAKDLHPVVCAAISHYEIARIHPYIDGNGRSARLLAALILYKSGFDHRRFFALDDFYDENRPEYYAVLKKVQQSGNDLTVWLEYFTSGVLYSVYKVKETIARLGLSSPADGLKKIELSPRQIEIIEHVKQNGSITSREMRARFKISRQAILKEINKLVKARIVVKTGKGRGAGYRLYNK
jgi:Fic family protein